MSYRGFSQGIPLAQFERELETLGGRLVSQVMRADTPTDATLSLTDSQVAATEYVVICPKSKPPNDPHCIPALGHGPNFELGLGVGFGVGVLITLLVFAAVFRKGRNGRTPS